MNVKKFVALCSVLVSVGVASKEASAGTLYRVPLASNYGGLTGGFSSWFDRNTGSGFLRYDGNTTASRNGHYGIDFSPTTGGIYAAASGKVVEVKNNCPDVPDKFCNDGMGNNVRILHGDGKTTVYLHMKQNSIVVAMNQYVLCSALLGNIGQSGDAPGGLHLHFELRNQTFGYSRDVALDPFGGAAGQEFGWRSSPVSYWVNQNYGSPTTQCQ